jgi:hypothetical protein
MEDIADKIILKRFDDFIDKTAKNILKIFCQPPIFTNKYIQKL